MRFPNLVAFLVVASGNTRDMDRERGPITQPSTEKGEIGTEPDPTTNQTDQHTNARLPEDKEHEHDSVFAWTYCR